MRVPPNNGQSTAPAPAATSAEPSSTQDTPESMLFDAIRNGDSQQFAYIINHFAVDLTAQNQDGQTALHQTIEHSHDDLTRLLLAKAKDDFRSKTILDAEDASGYTPAMRAAEKDNAAIVRAILEAGGRYSTNHRGDANVAPIIDKIKLLLVPLNSTGFKLAFFNAIHFEPPETIKFLFDAATSSEREEVVKTGLPGRGVKALTTMIQLGADTAGILEELAQSNDAAGIYKMHYCGANMTTPLANCARRGMTDAIKTFLAAEVDPLETVEYLLKSKDPTAIQCLMQAGMPTAPLLMTFARQHELEKARTLINLDADVATALNTLIENGEQDAANVLSVAMASALLAEKPKTDTASQ